MKKNNYLILLLFTLLLGNCKEEIILTSYSVKYMVYGTSYAAIVYYDIPDKGKVANELYPEVSPSLYTKLPWSALLAGRGYHNAPYKIKAKGGANDWLFVKVYQDGILVKADSAQGTDIVIELDGNLPK